MRTKVTLVLVFLNVALFFWIFHARNEWRIEAATAATRDLVLPPEATDIQSLELSDGLHPATRLERKGEAWLITQPENWPANPNAIARILNDLKFLRHDAAFTVEDIRKGGRTLADYGLEKPLLTLTLVSGGATPATFVLKIGAPTPDTKSLYLLSPDGTQIHVVGRNLAESLQLGLDQLRSLRLFSITVDEVRALNLQFPTDNAPPVSLARNGLGQAWAFESPHDARASKSETEKVIGELNALQAETGFFPRVRETSEAVTGLGQPITIKVEGNKRHETLYLGLPVTPPPPGTAAARGSTLRYARLDDREQIFAVAFPDRLLDTLGKAQETLREKLILDFDPARDAVISVKITAPNQPDLTIRHLEAAGDRAESWQIAAGSNPLTADRERVGRLLQDLAHLAATRFINAPTSAETETLGFSYPLRVVTLSLAPPVAPAATAAAPANPPPPPAQVVLELAHGPDGYSARIRGRAESFIYGLPDNALEKLPVAARVYRDRLVQALSQDENITSLTLRPNGDPAAPVVYSHALDLAAGETWSRVSAGMPPAQQVALSYVVNYLKNIRARQFVADSFSEQTMVNGESRPWAWRLDATISTLGAAAGTPPNTLTLYIGDRAGGSQLAGSRKLDVVFELETQFADALAELINENRNPSTGTAPPAATVPPTSTPAASVKP